MKRSRFTKKGSFTARQGIAQQCPERGVLKELCRKHGVSDATFYKWRSKYGGMEVFNAKKLKTLEVESTKLKKLLTEQMMDVSTLKEMLGKNF